MKPGILALTIASCLLSPGAHVQAQHQVLHELKIGVLAHDVDGLWSGSSKEEGVDINLEGVFRPSLGFLRGTIRPALGFSINTEGDTSKLYLDGRWQVDFDNGLFLALGLGAAVHDGKEDRGFRNRKALGSKILFHIPIEAGCRTSKHHSFSVYFDHVSNAELADENEGLDTLGIRYGFRF